jgi:hypothetical protein
MKKIKTVILLAAAWLTAALFTAKPALAAPELENFRLGEDNTAVLYKGKALADLEARPVAGGDEGEGIEYWAAVDPESVDGIAEEETGIWFFSSDGNALTFLPLDIFAAAVRDVNFSPGEEKFAAGFGGTRPDLIYSVYETADMKALTEGVNALMGVNWIDPHRVVFTRIDDIREGESAGRSYYFKFSAIVYDSAVDLTTVLKEATDAANYIVGGIDEENGKIILFEETVKNPADWGDEEKMEQKEIAVDIPAAG